MELALKHSLSVINEHAQKNRRTAEQINGEKKYKIHMQILGLIACYREGETRSGGGVGKGGCGGKGRVGERKTGGGGRVGRERGIERGKLTAMALRSSRLSIEPTDFLLSSSSHSFHLLAVVFRLPVSRRLLPVPPAPSWLSILPPIPCRQELAPSLTRQFVSPRFTFQQDVIDQSISQCMHHASIYKRWGRWYPR